MLLDYVLAGLLIALPFVAGFSDETEPTAFFIALGVAHLLITIGTRFRDAAAESARGRLGDSGGQALAPRSRLTAARSVRRKQLSSQPWRAASPPTMRSAPARRYASRRRPSGRPGRRPPGPAPTTPAAPSLTRFWAILRLATREPICQTIQPSTV